MFEGHAEQDGIDDAQVARQTPEHVGRVDFRPLPLAVVDDHVLFVGEVQAGIAPDAGDGMENAFFVARIRAGLHPERLDERPHGIVVIGRDAGDVGEEAGGAERLAGHAGADLFRLGGGGDIPQDGQRLTQGFGPRGNRQELPAIEVLGIKAFVFLPQILVDALAEPVGNGVIAGGIDPAENPFHLRQDAQRPVMDAAGAQILAVVDIGRIHPERILLLPPVQVGRFALHEAGNGVVIRKQVIFNALLDGRIDGFQPVPVSGNLVELPCGHRPDDAVRGDGPAAAGAGILDNPAPLVDLAEQALLGRRCLDVRHGQQGGIAHIPGPYAGPASAGAERGIRLHRTLALFQGKVVHGLLETGGRLIGGKTGNVTGEVPAPRKVCVRVIGQERTGIRCRGVVMAAGFLGYPLPVQDEGIRFPDCALSARCCKKTSKQHSDNAFIHVGRY